MLLNTRLAATAAAATAAAAAAAAAADDDDGDELDAPLAAAARHVVAVCSC